MGGLRCACVLVNMDLVLDESLISLPDLASGTKVYRCWRLMTQVVCMSVYPNSEDAHLKLLQCLVANTSRCSVRWRKFASITSTPIYN